MTHEFTMHYNVQNLILRNQGRRRKSHPRMRSKTISIRIDEIDVGFAVEQLTRGTSGPLQVLMEIGVALVNPGNLAKFRSLRKDVRDLRKKYESQINGQDPMAAATKVELQMGEEKMTKIRPDRYNKKLGRDQAKAALKQTTMTLTTVLAGPQKAGLRLEGNGMVVEYVKNFKTGSVRMHLLEIDGYDAVDTMAYN